MVAMMLTCLCAIIFSACSRKQSRLLNEAELLALDAPDSAATLLEEVDTANLDEADFMLYALTRALVLEEQWQRAHADTAVCLGDYEETWEFKRETMSSKGRLDEELDSMMADSSLLRAYHYYSEKSVGGVTNDEEDLRRFGRICYVLSRHHGENDSLLQKDQLYLLAIHCAEACGDSETAHRAYQQLGRHLQYAHHAANNEAHHCQRQALKHFARCRGDAQWLLTLVNDYGFSYLSLQSLNPRHFPTLVHAASLACKSGKVPETLYDSVAALIDSVENAPVLPFSSYMQYHSTYDGKLTVRELGVPKGMFEDAEHAYEEEAKEGRAATVKEKQQQFDEEMRRAINRLNVQTRTYLSAGYARQASMLQTRLLWAVIGCLILAVLVLLLFVWNWHEKVERKHKEELLKQEQEVERLSTQLQQKETLIAILRGNIIDKSEILEMLESKAGKRAIINARNWREMEATLDTADNHFVSRLRREYPSFSEDDIRLCMLTRLKLNNTVLADIYAISVSAVQHRKQKLKKDGFGVTDSKVTLDQVIENY